MTDFNSAIDTFITNVQNKIDAYYSENLSNLVASKLSIDPKGRKYVRIVVTNDGSGGRSVFCFINRENGDVLKAAGWKAPAKHARGTIYGEPEGYGVDEFGANYLR